MFECLKDINTWLLYTTLHRDKFCAYLVFTPIAGSNRQFSPVKVAQEVEVKAIAPPIYIRLIGLFYFTAFVGIGMAIGLLIQNRRKPQARENSIRLG